MILWLLCFFAPFPLPNQPVDGIERVKNSFLKIDENLRIGLALQGDRWFDRTLWVQTLHPPDGMRVIFRGEVNEAKAVAAFEEENRYKLNMALKSMQLAPVYGLHEGRKKVRFSLHFDVSEEGRVALNSGFLDILEADGSWREAQLSEKALLAVIEGIYRNENPYTSLVKGLPYL